MNTSVSGSDAEAAEADAAEAEADAARAAARWRAVAGATFATYLPYFFNLSLLTLYIQHRVCEDDGSASASSDGSDGCSSSRVSSIAAGWATLCSVGLMAPQVLTVACVAPRADFYGRRRLMLPPVAGILAYYATLFCVAAFDLPLPVLVAASVAAGACGGLTVFHTSVYAATADLTPLALRGGAALLTQRYGWMEGLACLALTAGPLLCGVAVDRVGFTACFAALVAAQLVTLACTACVPETRPRGAGSAAPPACSAAAAAAPAALACRSRRHFALVAAVLMFAFLHVVNSSAAILFVRHVFDWSREDTGYFLATAHAAKGTGVIVGLRVVRRFLPAVQDVTLLAAAVASEVAVYVAMGALGQVGTSGAEPWFWASQALWLLAGWHAPVAKAMLSRSCAGREQGATFAALGVVESTASLLSMPVLQEGVYAHTVTEGCPGCAFFASAAMLVALLCILPWAAGGGRDAAGDCAPATPPSSGGTPPSTPPTPAVPDPDEPLLTSPP